MKPLQGKRVLITRDATQAGSLKSMLVGNGAEVVIVPTISIGAPPTWQPFDQVTRYIKDFSWIVFGSVNAVLRTQLRLVNLGLNLKDFTDLKIAAVGDQTARQIKAFGWRVDLVPDKFQAEDLSAKLIATGIAGKKIWLPRALAARDVLPDAFQAAGATVMVTPVYQNRVPYENRDLLRETVREQQTDWVTFTSSSTVTNFFKILDWDLSTVQLPKLASIGAVTTETLHDHALEPEFTANPQNLAGLFQGIVACEFEAP